MSILVALLGRYWSYPALLAMSLLAWHFDARAVANADAVRVQASAFRQTQAAASSIAQHALLRVQAQYSAKAMEVNNAYQIQLASARGADDQYIAGHRVQSCTAASAARTAVAPAQDSGATVYAGLPPDAVVVSADDVHACTASVTYGFKARDYLLSIAAPAQPARTADDDR